tara:strand:- start:357 stop:761 length:405 start_codon:yes stop_codon:yes gene_type:complete
MKISEIELAGTKKRNMRGPRQDRKIQNDFTQRDVIDRLKEDPKDPFSTDVFPGSGGTYDIKSLQSMVARQLMDLAETIATADIDKPADPFYVRRAYKLLYNNDNPVFQDKMETLVKAYDKLAKQNRFKKQFGDI